MSNAIDKADSNAHERAVSARPVWSQIDTASSAFGMDENILLHAGPAFKSIAEISRPVMNSACVAAVYEGLAPGFNRAESMINSREILLKPAQDYGVVTPLAAVVSASMPLHVVHDEAARDGPCVYAPLNGGSQPSMRLGLRSSAVLKHIKWLNGAFCDVILDGLGDGIELIPYAVEALTNGDDCHGRTVYATKLLVGHFSRHTRDGITDPATLSFMNSSPSLFLNLWMAATKCMMQVASGITGSSLVTTAGGNGVDMGIQISGLPNRWFTCNAAPPQGRFEIECSNNRALGAIGDSAIIDNFGFGAMAINLAPAQQQSLGDYLPTNTDQRIEELKFGIHPAFKSLALKVGISARQVRQFGAGPVVALGILDQSGEHGRLGGGIYDMPLTLFEQALNALENESETRCG